MKINKALSTLRKEYSQVQIPPYLKNEGWSNLYYKLDENQARQFNFIHIGLVAVVLILISSVSYTAQFAKPGDALYPAKTTAEAVFLKINGDKNQKIENRAEEIIELAKEEKDLNQALTEFDKAIESSMKSAQNEQEKKELKQTLLMQEEKLRQTNSNSQNANDGLEKAAERAKNAQGEVKGEKEHMPNINGKQEKD